MTLWRVRAGSEHEQKDMFLKDGCIAIGYNYTEDLTAASSIEDITSYYQGKGEDRDRAPSVLWDFCHEAHEGDLIVIHFGEDLAVGRINGAYEFRPNFVEGLHHVRSVQWELPSVPPSAIPELRAGRGTAFHRIQADLDRIRERIREMGVSEGDPMDDYIRRVQPFIESGQFDRDEVEYKIEIIEQLKRAREAVIADNGEWPSVVKRSLAHNNNLIGGTWRAADVITNWAAAEPSTARTALTALWFDDGTPVGERIRAFLAQVPEDQNFKGGGTRLRVVAVLLMALGHDYPPFKITEFTKAYRATGRPVPTNADEGDMYAHALAFLDEILERTRALGFKRPADRLEAQSVVWMQGWIGDQPAEDDGTVPEPEASPEPAPDLDALGRELLLEPQDYLKTIDQLLREKKQVIFQGPPGTGKTYVARRLARALAGADERVRLVQFHPSYAYEDFVQGFRPTLRDGQAGFELRDGPLVEMADRARGEPDKAHFLVIDEINRGNLAKVFGELYFLLEYRDQPMQLQYAREGDEDFSLPDNLYIIGTMNTADRSIALVDLALRRRFSFVEFHPEKEPIKGLLGRWLDREEVDMPWLADVVELANGKLENREAAIGPSYFMKDGLDEERVARIWKHDVLPYVEEQLYGQHERLAEFELEALRREAAGGETDGATGDEQEGEDGSGDADA